MYFCSFATTQEMKKTFDDSDSADNTRIIDLKLKDIEEMIEKIVRKELAEIKELIDSQFPTNDFFLPRNKAAEFLSITLPTLRTWTKDGIIKDKKIRGRVYYQLKDILLAMKENSTTVRK